MHDAEQADFPNVFGLIDRDFLRTNEAAWVDPNRTFRTFILPVHEIENYLLDSSALFGCRFDNLSKSRDEIDALLQAEAVRRRSWAACREVVALLRDRFRGHFLTEPKAPPVLTDTDALSHICDSAWFRTLPRRVAAVTQPRVRHLLSRAYVRAGRRIQDGTWRMEFAGKEILRDIGSRILDATKVATYKPTKAEFDTDLAKEVAAWQVANAATPPALARLRSALKSRIAP